MSFFLKSWGENMLVKRVGFLPAGIKSVNAMQKDPHITELLACTQTMLAIMFLFLTIFLISSGICSTPNYQNTQFHFCYKIKKFNVCLHLHIHQGLLRILHPSFFRQITFEKTPLNLGSF